VITAPEGARLNSPCWSPDGKNIAYSQITGNKTRLMISGEAIGTVDDVFPFPATWLSANQILYTGNGKIFVTTLGGESKTVPFQAKFQLNRPAYKRRQLDFDTTTARQVKGIVTPALSPDGNRIVFEALNQLWVMDIGGKPQQLTNGNYYKQSPAWSPDGKQIAYTSDKAGTADIYILDLATKSERRVTNLPDSAEIEPASRWQETRLSERCHHLHG
jgi:Tol biopolymer transport system component